MHAALLTLLTVCLGGDPGEPANTSSARVVVRNCQVALIEEARISANEAGELVELEAKLGLEVEPDTVLGRIDDRQPQAELVVAEKEAQVARTQAENDIEVKVADKLTQVTKAEYDQVVEANTKVPGAKSQSEIRIKRYKWEEARLQTEKATVDQQIMVLTADAKNAKLDAARIAVQRRQIKSRIKGQVVELLLHAGEWANPGDAVLRIIRLDTLWIEGFVSIKECNPTLLLGRKAEFKSPLNDTTFVGKIEFVKPEIEPGGELVLIKAKVVNTRLANNQWVLLPGLKGEMAIELTDVAERPTAAAGRGPELPRRR
ncbi:MAG: efflux RND transporter periplasmic adaptor subunit [Pirellulales bacterium]|nr:efflux RND transporter periplasmic adaptor subunit [Pirellulales bacterium]